MERRCCTCCLREFNNCRDDGEDDAFGEVCLELPTLRDVTPRELRSLTLEDGAVAVCHDEEDKTAAVGAENG